MKNLGGEYGNWLEAQVQHWEKVGKRLETENPNWRKEVADPTVANVLPPKYNPHLHRELLRQAGADPNIVDEVLQGIKMSGPGNPTGFFDPLPSKDFEDIKRFDEELQKAIKRGPKRSQQAPQQAANGERGPMQGWRCF